MSYNQDNIWLCSSEEDKAACDICRLTVNARGKNRWVVMPRICCTITQWFTFSTSYGTGQKKILGKVTLWMCQKRQLPAAIFNCRNLIRKDGCTRLVFLPLHSLCRSDSPVCAITMDNVSCAGVDGTVSVLSTGWPAWPGLNFPENILSVETPSWLHHEDKERRANQEKGCGVFCCDVFDLSYKP